MPEGDADPEVASVEAPTATEAVSRLREVVGTRTDVPYVLPGPPADESQGPTYEAFLHDPDAASPV